MRPTEKASLCFLWFTRHAPRCYCLHFFLDFRCPLAIQSSLLLVISFAIRHWGFFGGLHDADIAEGLGENTRMVRGDWARATSRLAQMAVELTVHIPGAAWGWTSDRSGKEKEQALARKVKIPESKAGLKRPLNERHAFLLIEDNNAWITSPNRELAETFCSLITRGDPVTVVKTGRVIVWGIYAGEPEETGTIVLDRKPDGRFKLVPLDVTPSRLLTRVAHLVGRPGSVTSDEGQHGLVLRGELRRPGEPIATGATAQEPQPESAPAPEAPTGRFEKITGADAIAAVGQRVTIESLERGVKVRIRGKRADCEKTAKHILKGGPTVASEQGAKYMIEGNLNASFLRKGANQEGPDANGVYTREDGSERTFTAFGENLTAVQAACLRGCKEGTMFTIVVNDRSAGQFVISSGRRRSV